MSLPKQYAEIISWLMSNNLTYQTPIAKPFVGWKSALGLGFDYEIGHFELLLTPIQHRCYLHSSPGKGVQVEKRNVSR